MPAILAAIPAGILAASKAAASVGVTATGAVVGYGVIREIQKGDQPTPQISYGVINGFGNQVRIINGSEFWGYHQYPHNCGSIVGGRSDHVAL